MTASSEPLPVKFAGPAIALALAGSALAIASLWAPWAVPGWDDTAVPQESGWQWMAYGDVLLIVTCGVVVAVVVWVCARPARHGVGLGIGAVILLACSMMGTLVVAALTTITFVDFDTVDYNAGRGPEYALVGLSVAAAGVVVAMLGAAPRDPSPLAHPGWHLPGHGQHSHTHGT